MTRAAPIRIATARLALRPLTEADAPALSAIGGRPDVARMLLSVRSPWPLDAVKAWIAKSRWTGRIGFRLAVCLTDGTLIGTVGLGGTPVSCNYFLDPARWGQGYATEALRALLRDSFARFDLDLVAADHFADNPVSGRVLTKIGFERIGEGEARSAARLEPAPNVLYRLIRRRFEAAS